MTAEATDRKHSRWVLAAEVATVAMCTAYIVVLLYPDETERGMRGWSWTSKACYHAAEILGRTGMACERRYLALIGG